MKQADDWSSVRCWVDEFGPFATRATGGVRLIMMRKMPPQHLPRGVATKILSCVKILWQTRGRGEPSVFIAEARPPHHGSAGYCQV